MTSRGINTELTPTLRRSKIAVTAPQTVWIFLVFCVIFRFPKVISALLSGLEVAPTDNTELTAQTGIDHYTVQTTPKILVLDTVEKRVRYCSVGQCIVFVVAGGRRIESRSLATRYYSE